MPKMPFRKKESANNEPPVTIKPIVALYVVLTLVALFFAVSLVWVYAWPNMFGTRGVSLRERMPYPMVVFSPTNIITYREYSKNTEAVQRFYENQDFSQIGLRVDFTTEEGKKRLAIRKKEVLNKMIEDEALRRIAKEEGIAVTQDMARESIKRTLDEYGTSSRVQSDLERLYGFNLADFEDKVVMPKLYQEKVAAFFQETMKPGDRAKEKIDEAKKALDQGKNFPEVAKQFSEGQTKDDGGDLGWFQLGDLAPELRSVVPTQTIGIPGSIIESELGYHIVLLEEIKKEDAKVLYRIRQIFTRKDLFADWLTKKMQAMPIYVLSPEYRFDTKSAQVEFKDSNMQSFEEKLYSKPDGDPMFLF